MNLLEDAWIPVKRKSGKSDIIAPWQITDTDDPVLSLHAVRPDFNGALLQFLIGLLQTAMPPKDYDKWVDWLEEPPLPELLQEKFMPYMEAFNLDGDGPKFMQDYDQLENKPWPIEWLLIDAPTKNTLKENRDLFVKKNQVNGVCPACLATALYTLQINAPGGGAGYHTSIRGLSPLTTLVVLDPKQQEDDCYSEKLEESLWRNIWLNVLQEKVMSVPLNSGLSEHKDIFPWLAPTRTSKKKAGVQTSPLDTHPLQIYWAMPRRIRIDWGKTIPGDCGLCGIYSHSLVSQYVTQQYGVDYTGPWQHPLAPYQVIDNQGDISPKKVPREGLIYHHWLGLIEKSDVDIPAKVVRRYQKVLKQAKEQFRLYVFGYEIIKNNKANCWYETTFPLYLIQEEIRETFTARVQTLTLTAEKTAEALRTCIKEAWFKRPGDARGDTSFLTQAFYQHTEPFFFKAVQQLIQKIPQKTDIEILQGWHSTLRRSGLQLFDYWAEQGDISESDPRRIAVAREKLLKSFNSKNIREILHIPVKKGRKV